MDTTPDDENELVNRIRTKIAKWRDDNYPYATAATRQLLFHWRSETNEPRLFFAQVEAAETLIWLTEGNARTDPVLTEIRKQLAAASHEYNNSKRDPDDHSKHCEHAIYRLAVRMATGSGKTAVMGMMIACAVNAAASPRKDRYTTLFLALAPNHTVRERLAVLDPSHPDNVYDEMHLLPEGNRRALGGIKVRVLNWHVFQRRDRLGDLSTDGKSSSAPAARARNLKPCLRCYVERSAGFRQVRRAEGVRAQR